jgi:glycosyltransferase involved in cell wall biosynthesis
MRANVVINRINAAILRRWVGRTAAKLGLRDVVYWNVQPAMPGIARAVRPALTLYHCVDDFSALPHWWHQSGALLAREAETCREADIVVCTARKLVETRRQYNANIHFVPNAANVELFAASTASETAVPEDIARLPKPVVGVFGVIDFRTDAGVLARIARERPGWSVAIVGLVKGDIDLRELRSLPNVHIFGKKPTDELPGYLKAMDVALIAYAMIDYNHHVFPLKLYDYLAAGRPIVASDLEELRPLASEHMSIARSADDWVSLIEAALSSNTPERARARQQIAAAQSWDHRVEEVSAIVAPLLRSAISSEPRTVAGQSEVVAR